MSFSTQNSPSSDETHSQYHPEFANVPGPDNVVTLVSRDGMRFRISSNVLKASSGVFETTLSLPQPSGASQYEVVIDSLDEDAQTIEGLLRMITAKDIPSLETLDAIKPLALAAEKWDMSGPRSIIRVILKNPSYHEEPIRLYALACRLGWDDVASLASKHSVNRDLYRDDLQLLLGRMDSRDLLRLMKLHRARRQSVENFLDGDKMRGAHTCALMPVGYPQTSLADLIEFQRFRWMILQDVDDISPARSISEETLREKMTTSKLDTAACPTCGKPYFPAASVKWIMNEHWATLPQTV